MCQAWGCRFAPRTMARRGRGCRKAGRPGPARRAGMGERGLQAGVSPATHAHLTPPPAPHRVPTRQAGGRHTRCTRQGPWVWRGPPRGAHLGGFRRRGVQAPPAKQVQQRRGRPAAAPGGGPDLVTIGLGVSPQRLPTPDHAQRQQRSGSRGERAPRLTPASAVPARPPPRGQSPSQLMLLQHLKGPSRRLLAAPSGWGTPGLLLDSGLRPPGRAGPRTQCRTQACGRSPCCWRPLRPGLSTRGANPPKGPRPFWPQGWAGRAPSPPGAPTAAGPGDTKPPSIDLVPSLGTRSGRANIGSETPQGEWLCPPTGKETLPKALSLGTHDGPWGHPLPSSRQRGPQTPPGKGPSRSSSRSNSSMNTRPRPSARPRAPGGGPDPTLPV